MTFALGFICGVAALAAFNELRAMSRTIAAAEDMYWAGRREDGNP